MTIIGHINHLEQVGAANIRPTGSEYSWIAHQGEVAAGFDLRWQSVNGILVPPWVSPVEYTGLRATPRRAFVESRGA